MTAAHHPRARRPGGVRTDIRRYWSDWCADDGVVWPVIIGGTAIFCVVVMALAALAQDWRGVAHEFIAFSLLASLSRLAVERARHRAERRLFEVTLDGLRKDRDAALALIADDLAGVVIARARREGGIR